MGNTNKNTHFLWGLALLSWLIGGFGGVIIDIDHILSAITEGQLPWAFLHNPFVAVFFFGCIIAFIGGLVISLVLDRR